MKSNIITDAKNRLRALIDRVRLARLERQGVLRPRGASKPGRLMRTPPAGRERDVSLSRLVRAERDEGR